MLGMVGHAHIILAVGKQRPEDLCESEACLCYMANPRPEKGLRYPAAKGVLRVNPPASASHALELQVCVTMPSLPLPLSHPLILPWLGKHSHDASSQTRLFWTLPPSSWATLPTKYLVLFCTNPVVQISFWGDHEQNPSLNLARSFSLL